MRLSDKIVFIRVMPSSLLDSLSTYYEHYFPAESFCGWLSYGSKTYLSRREFSLTLHNDVYIRYCSYKNPEELRKVLRTRCPIKIDVGAVYNDLPSSRHINAILPIEKELVFDIDLTDYDEIRTCCEGAKCCIKCWQFIRIAVKVIQAGLTADFGCHKLLVVYSGRRGVHIWVCDKRARMLSDTIRSAILSYFSVVKGGAEQAKKVSLHEIHPSIRRSIEIIKPFFLGILEDQQLLELPEKISKMHALCETGNASIERCLPSDNGNSVAEKWSTMVQHESEKTRSEIMLQYTYPRLDVHVSTKMNHLLKSPFSAHPSTQRICLPIWDIDTFDPTACITLQDVLKDASAFLEHVKRFDAFVDGLAQEAHVPDKVVSMRETTAWRSRWTFKLLLRRNK